MDSWTIKKCLRKFTSKKSFLVRIIFFFFIFFFVFHVIKFEPKKSFFLTSNIIELPDFSPYVSSNSFNKKPTSQNNNTIDVIIEHTILFPDFLLVILANNGNNFSMYNISYYKIDCVYNGSVYPMLNFDGFDSGESRWFVRCPIPPLNNLVAVGLRLHRDKVAQLVAENQTILSWSNKLVYEATFDGEEIVAIFVKGLGLNGEKRSNPSQFFCKFGKSLELSTKAITAAQEVIRCPLPLGVTRSSIVEKNEEIQVTIERKIGSKSYVVPSIAKLHKKNDNDFIKGNNNYKYELCACTMVWNQAAFIKEWIAYHAWLGIQRWFVYDNNSDDGLREVISDLNSENYNVSRHSWPWLKSQEAGFAHSLLKARDQCSWIAFFDVDEFYYFTSPKLGHKVKEEHAGQNRLRDVVHNLSSSPFKGQMKTNCYNFGPSKLRESPKEGVPLGYTCRLRNFDRHKSIVRPDSVDESLLNRVHHFELKPGFSGKTLSLKTAVINHYKYPVWDVFKAKFERRVSAYVVDWKENKNEESKDRTPGLGTEAIEPQDWSSRFCEVWDTRLRDFIRSNLANFNSTLLLPWH
ncbi:hypothetical protein RND81_14G195300 [Saponaria officinalis]|uniref:Glycosyltransferase family 92 protein n=1 Tax=Saponaria officinalis TaxID=3572 RepID=A0AAW1GZP8_SAPOF